jgi:hypothetical protein
MDLNTRSKGAGSDVGIQDPAGRFRSSKVPGNRGGSFQSTVPTFQGRGGNTVYTVRAQRGGWRAVEVILPRYHQHRRDRRSQVQATLYTAEYGLKSGAQVNWLHKQGGSSSTARRLYKRHEQFNAQNSLTISLNKRRRRHRDPRPQATLRYSDISAHHRSGPIPVKIRFSIRTATGSTSSTRWRTCGLKERDAIEAVHNGRQRFERAEGISRRPDSGGALIVVRDPTNKQDAAGNLCSVCEQCHSGNRASTLGVQC